MSGVAQGGRTNRKLKSPQLIKDLEVTIRHCGNSPRHRLNAETLAET